MSAGPVISGRADATSIETVTAIIEGRAADIIGWVCDVRDIARAHVLAAEVNLNNTDIAGPANGCMMGMSWAHGHIDHGTAMKSGRPPPACCRFAESLLLCCRSLMLRGGTLVSTVSESGRKGKGGGISPHNILWELKHYRNNC